MNVYKLNYNYVDYHSFTIEGVELYSKMPDYSPRYPAAPRRDTWVKPEASFYKSANCEAVQTRVSDITIWCAGVLVLNARAYLALNADLADLGEFLPVSCRGGTYHLFNVLNVIDDTAIDTQRTQAHIENGMFLGLERLAFHEDKLGDQVLFKTRADKLVSSYCTDAFKQRIEELGLEGLVFASNLTAL